MIRLRKDWQKFRTVFAMPTSIGCFFVELCTGALLEKRIRFVSIQELHNLSSLICVFLLEIELSQTISGPFDATAASSQLQSFLKPFEFDAWMLGFECNPGIIFNDIIRCSIFVIAQYRMEFEGTFTTFICSQLNSCVCITSFEYDAWAIFMGQSYENRMRSIEFMCLYSLLGL